MNRSEIIPWLVTGWRPFALAALLFVGALASLWSFGGSLFVPEDSHAYKTLEGENNVLREQNNGLRAENEAIKQERAGYQADLKKAGKITDEGIQKQQEATKQYAEELATIGVDIPEWDRCQRYCGTRAANGIPCRPSPDAYCRLQATGQQP